MAFELKRFFLVSPQPKMASMALLLLRLVAGLAFVYHGWGKIQSPFTWMGPEAPVPALFQFLAAFSEFGGGLAWMAGLLTPLASLGIGFTMVVAVAMHAVVMKDPFVNPTGGGSYELALLYLVIALVLIALGAGHFSLDAKVFGEKE
jgi:putative oxidoreductase